MASNQPTEAVVVVPNDDINIPDPGVYKSGTNTGAGETGFPYRPVSLWYVGLNKTLI